MGEKARPSPFRRAVEGAAAVAGGRQPFGRLFAAAAAILRGHPSALSRIRDDAGALYRMARETLAGRYRKLPKRSLIAAVAALFYLVDPIDLIPDVLPALGFLDDAVVLAWVVRQIRRDIDAFLVWESEWGGAIDVPGEEVADDGVAAPLPPDAPPAP
jgi:uncharacterized membrane protein YkvA (DUF1232 family)